MADSLSDGKNDDDEMEEEAVHDSLQKYLLTYRFSDHAFPWRAFQAAGWKHSAQGYVAPTGQVFADTTQINPVFDRFSVPEVFSNLQSFPSRKFDDDDKEQEEATEMLRLRNEILVELHALTKGVDPDKGIGTMVEEAFQESRTDWKESSDVRRLTRAVASKTESATRAEKGSDLYLHKNARRRILKSLSRKNSAVQPAVPTDELILPTIEDCEKYVESLSVEGVEKVESEYERHFEDWRFLLSTNHSLLLFGAGSKFNLINSFCREELNKEGYSLVINGFEKDVSVEGILDLLVLLFLEKKEPKPSSAIPPDDGDFPVVGISNPWRASALVERATSISRAIAINAMETLLPIFLVIHSFDCLRIPVEQQALAALLVNSNVSNGTRSIRLVASIDHVDAATLLSHSANFSWIWKEVHTHRPYLKELKVLERTDIRRKATKATVLVEEQHVSRVMNVLQNIAPRHTEMLQILATLQLDQQERSGGKWVEYGLFRDQCLSCYLASKELLLRPLLMELKDHRLIQSKLVEGLERLSIPYDNDKLHEILAYRRDHGE
jgi:origin recognition complex subunit 2